MDAVVGWVNSPHHRGDNDTNTVYNDLELLLRSPKHIERFRDLARKPTRTGFQTAATRQASRFDQVADELEKRGL
jgi:hypothetical protein